MRKLGAESLLRSLLLCYFKGIFSDSNNIFNYGMNQQI